ncbi:MAG TPA: metallophosphoesterase, partial [Gemmatimonadales bacterium]|nr:metallophosphoesterase [Gemmatimonadales bacterium]
MRRSLFRMYAGILLLLPACKPSIKTTPPPADAPAEVVAMTGASVMIAAGDIASCTSQGDELTAALVDSVLRADSAAVVEDVVAALGDNAYPDGSDQNFALCFTPSWGDSAKRIIQRIRPAPGNHEFSIFGASPYFEYFGKKAGEPRKGYYSYSIGDWHAVVLNSEIVVNPVFTAEDRKAQMDWLNDDLKFNTKKCTVAYWHNPRFSSGWHGSDRLLTEFWQVLFANNV